MAKKTNIDENLYETVPVLLDALFNLAVKNYIDNITKLISYKDLEQYLQERHSDYIECRFE